MMLLLPTIDPAHALLFSAPATHFTESCPLGNGRLGAMVFGGVQRERIVLNESTMWSGSEQPADRPDAYKALPEIRRLLLAGENAKAQALLQKEFVCQGPGSGFANGKELPFGCYQVFGDLSLDFGTSNFQNYQRTLDLDKAMAVTEYEQAGVRFRRESFVSAPAQAIVYRVTANRRGAISFAASLNRPERSAVSSDGNDLVIRGALSSGVPNQLGTSSDSNITAQPALPDDDFDIKKHAYLNKPFVHFKNLKPLVYKPDPVPEPEVKPIPTVEPITEQPSQELLPEANDAPSKFVKVPETANRVKKESPPVPETLNIRKLQPDNVDSTSAKSGFGIKFPDSSAKGDMFLRVDYLPNKLFKHNGFKWIEVDKDKTDSYTYDEQYIQYLIEKIKSGEYEIDQLSDTEQDLVAQQLQKNNAKT